VPAVQPKVHVEPVLVVTVGSGYDWHDGLLVLWLQPGGSWMFVDDNSSEQEPGVGLARELSPR